MSLPFKCFVHSYWNSFPLLRGINVKLRRFDINYLWRTGLPGFFHVDMTNAAVREIGILL